MRISLAPRFLSKGINFYALYGFVSSGVTSLEVFFFAILAIVFEISFDCCSKCVKIRLHSFTSTPAGA